MKHVWTTTKTALLLLSIAGTTACQRGAPELEVRTFALQHLSSDEAGALIDPYVYWGREGAEGQISATEGAISVRETPDNLERIARVLAEFDKPRPDTQLHFQLIEADGFTERDPRIATVEDELRGLFQFRGYRLAGEAFVAAANGSSLSQRMRVGDADYSIRGTVYEQSTGAIRLEDISLWSEEDQVALETTVTVRPGQTLVLGSSPRGGSSATLFLTVRAGGDSTDVER